MTTIAQTVARLLLAPLLVVAAAILVKGYTDVGDGFTAGILVATGVLMQGVAFGHRQAERLLPMRVAYRLAIGGLLLGVVLMLAPLLLGDPIFTHRPLPGESPVKLGTLELITPVLFDVGVLLLVLGTVVAGVHLFARPPEEDRS